MTTVDHGTAWCPRCQRRVPIADRFTATEYTPRGEVAYAVTALDCGHDAATDRGIIGGAP